MATHRPACATRDGSFQGWAATQGIDDATIEPAQSNLLE